MSRPLPACFGCLSRYRLGAILAGACVFGACSVSHPRVPVNSPAPAEPQEDSAKRAPPRDNGRLPELATPLRYALSFDIDPREESFRGETRIDVEIPAQTSYVVLHSHGQSITSARAVLEDAAQPSRVARVSARAAHGAPPADKDELVLSFDPPLSPGRATLELTHSTLFGRELSGLYRIKDGGAWYAFTQFEATFARRAFPCFDEPGFKVPFALSVRVPKGMRAFANTPVKSQEDSLDKTVFRFADTPPLPTYLVALVVGDFDVREATRSTKPPIRLITTKGKTGMGALALEATFGLVDALSGWFGSPYPYEKLDIVAVPEFDAGGMENAGLLTFREELLLLDPARASADARRMQALALAHELAHQWFGNLVTAAWWDDLWLNEGFATWMESRIVDVWNPALGAKLDAAAAYLDVMDTDALASARAVRQPVVTTSEAIEAFDAITYEKGAAVISTIEAWVGEEAFKTGVRTYLKANAFKSVGADQLFSELDRASGKNVTQMAASYLDRTGVPEVTARFACDQGARWHIELGQQPWRPLGSRAHEESEQTWTVPVCVRAQGEKSVQCADLASGAPSIVAGRKCPAWVHPNPDSRYYRFAMDVPQMLKLAKARAQLDVPERLSLLSNAWAGVRSGRLNAGFMLKILPLFDDDPTRQVILALVSTLSTMSQTLVGDEARPAFREFVKERLAKRTSELGWLSVPSNHARSGDIDDTSVLRQAVLSAMGNLAEDEATLRKAEEFAVRWLADPASVDPNLAAVALDLAARHGGADRLAALHGTARTARTSEDRIVALKATAGFDDPALLRRALDATLGEDMRPQDVMYVLSAAFARRTARAPTEAWVRDRWDDLRKKLPGALGARLMYAAGIACTKAELDARTAFYSPRARTMEGSARPLAEALESASLCTALRAGGSASFTRELLNLKTIKK